MAPAGINFLYIERDRMKTYAPFNLIVHYPQTEEGKRELASRVAEAHAEAVLTYMEKSSFPDGDALAQVFSENGFVGVSQMNC